MNDRESIRGKLLKGLDLPSASPEIRAEALRELEKRAFFGAFIYLTCWAGVALSANLPERAPAVFWRPFTAFAIILLARIVVHRYFEDLLARGEAIARYVLCALVLAAGAIYGMLTLFSTASPVLQEIYLPLLVSCAVICSTATMILSIDPILRFGMPAVMLLPFAARLPMQEGGLTETMAILLVVNFFYLTVAAQRTAFDYWTSISTKGMLREQSATFKKLSLTDPLTGIPNRLAARERLSIMWQRYQGEGAHFSVLLVDIDHFKAINDSYGHHAGDLSLIAIANILQVQGDFGFEAARYGGEEFLVCVAAGGSDALRFAEEIRCRVADVRVEVDGKQIAMSCSIGVAHAGAARTIAELVDAADKALYQAKQTGRNRVVQHASMASGCGVAGGASRA